MNLMAFLQRGMGQTEAQRRQAELNAAAEETRAQWLRALSHDRLRAWMHVGEADAGVIQAMATMLTIAGMVHVHATGRTDTPTLRIIRGAISAATQCATAGCVVTADDARAWGVAVERAIEVVKAARVASIIHASVEIRKTVGLT